MQNSKMKKGFFERSATEVAPDLLGKTLVRKTDGHIISGKIVETEAYVGEEDLACHARNGKTERNKVMYDRAGLIYIYLVYGMYYNFNIVTAKKHVPEAVLIRALEPIDGLELAKNNLKDFGRVRADKDFMKGPGKLCAALDLDKSFYGEDITNSKRIWTEDSRSSDGEHTASSSVISDSPLCHSREGGNLEIETSKRIGIDYADIYRDKLWRYMIKDSKYISK